MPQSYLGKLNKVITFVDNQCTKLPSLNELEEVKSIKTELQLTKTAMETTPTSHMILGMALNDADNHKGRIKDLVKQLKKKKSNTVVE